MRARLLSLGPIICVAAMLNICGGPRLILQSVAWASMLIKYSQYGELAEAVAKTFDGAHPCNICKGVQQENPEQNIPVEKKWDLKIYASPRARILYPPASFALQSALRQEALTWADAPPTPPPRSTVS